MLAWLSVWSEVPLTVSCFSKIQIGFTFLVPAHLGSPGQRAVKRVCVCVDYCNSLLSRLPRSTSQPLQRVINAVARVITNLSLRDHVKPALKQLHWLPVEQRITYKLCLFMHHIHTGQAPQYLSDCVSAVSALSGSYRLRSTGSAGYVLPRTRTRFGERGFSYCGPAAWNTLPSNLHDITDTDIFRKRLKSVLYDCAYH